MRDLNRYVVKKHATDWWDIGLELGLELHLLQTIKKDNPQQSVICFQETLDRWLKLNPKATWKILEIALTNVNRQNLELDPVDDVYGKSLGVCNTLPLHLQPCTNTIAENASSNKLDHIHTSNTVSQIKRPFKEMILCCKICFCSF